MAVATMVLSTAAMKMAIKAAARTSVRRDPVWAGAPLCVTTWPTGEGSGLKNPEPWSASSRARWLGTEAHDHLADVVAGEEPQECGHRPIDALDDRLLVPDASRLEPPADF